MTKTWEGGWEHGGQAYQLRTFEDMRGQEPAVFVVERSDGVEMQGSEAREVHAELASQASLEVSNSRLWEQTPDGTLMEHSFTQTQQDVNPLQTDLPAFEYDRAVRAGELEREMQTAFQYSKTDIQPEEALETTGHEVQSYEQQMEQDWSRLSGPEVSHD